MNEFVNLFEDYDVFNLTDLGLGDAVEDGTSFLENALIKAKHGSLLLVNILLQMIQVWLFLN